MRKSWLTAAIPLAAITGVVVAMAPAASGTTTTLSAKTTMTNRPDSAANITGNTNGGNWALDNFIRGAQIFFKGSAPASSCGGTSPCYHYTGKVSDVGHFTTDVGQPSPGFGYLNGGGDPTMAVAVTGTLKGSQTYDFYTTVPISGASASNVPTTENGDIHSSSMWPELFFPAGTPFYEGGTLSNSLGTGFFSYTYNAKAGSDQACPNVTSQWVDASTNGSGSAPSGGNILAPGSSGC